ncbi:MAG: hypothetical protein K6F94_06985 [Bacteroidaceae bacterium]|nr:hypothetical protein [Bacteroidaceae bacterium]
MKRFNPDQHKNSRPFRTPDGYFDDFTSRMMARIATEGQARAEEHTGGQICASEHNGHIRPLFGNARRFTRYAVAATLAGLVFGTGAYLLSRQTQDVDAILTAAQEENIDEKYINDALDYEMVNNQEIAYYLTEAY